MTDTMKSLYSALGRHGLRKTDVRAILPAWWDDEIADTAAGLQQAKLFVAKALNLKIRPLVETPPRVEFDLPAERRFKLAKGTTEEHVSLAVALARSASKIVLSSMDREFTRPGSAAEVRAHILASGRRWVDLEGLVNYCWQCGIPVVHLASSLMKKKMDGIAMSTKGRPSIVLSSRRVYGFMLFHLAHELGHVALGHLEPNGAIVDTTIEKDPEGKDDAERAADGYALELLSGHQGNLRLARVQKPAALAHTVTEYGKQYQIAPSHVLLNCAYNGDFWGLCSNTLKVLCERDGSTDKQVLDRHLYENLPADIKEDNLGILGTLVGS
ncbi:ImmA/IrrE family metallo-endopeptidase [Pseudomonas aeruginosa]|uniref:ImmA/IrrE family metallo-endopeptidase n=1 Tax=Pseudomonas TaxID=286 RepID=UPI001E3AB7F2|nr:MULTISPECIES: ImmA/IrrE family metallo-endopeptidase [Pseudomonas]MDM3892778.1 ImmA/IrrE family metallo-endopeptidase [Pseudomonas juntendi]WBM33160.1 ImmA/IrrE family metallo-endopeptidase [Pseudomonas sp. NY11382]